ncbi:MAG: cob(I)yrinic acid a,c-diamide adenosyltransferase [Eubacterium sp.]
MPNVYTRGGDKGQTGLFGGNRTAKDDIRVEAYGTMDEANSTIGLAYSLSDDKDIREILHHLQKRIFVLGAELASDDKGKGMLQDSISQADIDYMEEKLDYYLAIIGPQKDFVIPGKNPASSALHMARTVVRRAERRIVTYTYQDPDVRPELIKFANRLSDLLFVLARTEEYNEMVKEIIKRVIAKIEMTKDPSEEVKDVSLLTTAKRMGAAARVKAEELGVPIVFTVVDSGGNLAYYERMENSLLASIDISMNKAYTANALKMPTDQVTDLAKENGALFGIQFTNEGRIVTFGGGYPLIVEGKIIGGLGVSGGTADQDMAIAQSALGIL